MSSQIKYELLPIEGFTGGTNNDKYRWYHCNVDNDIMNCRKVANFNTESEKKNSQLMFVHKSIPESLDAFILKWKMYPEGLVTLTPTHLTSPFSNEPRYYQCHTVNGKQPICQRLDCKPDCLCMAFTIGSLRSKHVLIPGSVPRFLDSALLKYKWVPNYVNIESNQS